MTGIKAANPSFDVGWSEWPRSWDGCTSHTYRVLLDDRLVSTHVATVEWSYRPEDRYFRLWPGGEGTCQPVKFPPEVDTLPDALVYVETLFRMGSAPEEWSAI